MTLTAGSRLGLYEIILPFGADGMEQINEQWFGSTINMYADYLIYAGYAAAGALLLVAVLVGWNRTLSKRVLKQTADLGESEKLLRQITGNIQEVFWLTDTQRQTMFYVS